MALPSRSFPFIVVLAASAVCCAQQQKFPLHSGDWEVSTTFSGATKPYTLHVCLDDELWTKALSANPDCSMQNLSVFKKGVSYVEDCPTKKPPMRGRIELTFDGKEHMTGRATFDKITDSGSSNSAMVVDYRWKSPTCGPDDVNIKQPQPQPSPAK